MGMSGPKNGGTVPFIDIYRTPVGEKQPELIVSIYDIPLIIMPSMIIKDPRSDFWERSGHIGSSREEFTRNWRFLGNPHILGSLVDINGLV